MNPLPRTSEVPIDQWLVVWTKSRAEKKVAHQMVTMGLESWLPMVKESHQWSDRWRDVQCPLFPGYVFCRAHNADWYRILRTPGALTVIKEGGRPALLSGSFVAGLRDAIGREGVVPERIIDCADFALGDEVIVQGGVLSGIRGVVREWKGKRKLVIWVREIGRGVAFAIGTERLRSARSEPLINAALCGLQE